MFGKEKPLKEVLRENKRMINRAVRELDREKTALEREEKRLTMDIKKAAKEQQMAAVKIMAKVISNKKLCSLARTLSELRVFGILIMRSVSPLISALCLSIVVQDLVRTRQYITKFIEMRSHLQGCALKLQTVKSHHAMAEAMKSTATAMHKMNKAVDVPAITKMMAEFEKENAKTEIMQEIMGDTLDDALADENTEEEEQAVVNQVLDEIGITFGQELPEAALGTPAVKETATPGKVPVAATEDPALSELEARLNNLKR